MYTCTLLTVHITSFYIQDDLLHGLLCRVGGGGDGADSEHRGYRHPCVNHPLSDRGRGGGGSGQVNTYLYQDYV